jgi:glutamate dehydrogenase (NADP+)
VNLSILRFLALEQVLKNALTGLPMGGGKGGSDFDPKGKSDAEIRRFSKAFGTALAKHIGPDTDVPAGDIGFTGENAGYVFGVYKQLKSEWSGMITGKGPDWGGSALRPEATGYGLVYYVDHMIKLVEGAQGGFKGKKVVVSGSGQVAQFAALKVIELGGTVLSFSDSKGSLIAKGDSSFSEQDIEEIYKIKIARKELSTLGDKGGKFEFHGDGARPWKLVKAYDVALPSATQNEVDESDAEAVIKAGCHFIAEGSNMGCTLEAIQAFEKTRAKDGKKGVLYGPGKAANSGGVAVSGLEMAQNSMRLKWSAEEVDTKLKGIMQECFNICKTTGESFGDGAEVPSLVAGANIAGFKKVADAMKAHGDWW